MPFSEELGGSRLFLDKGDEKGEGEKWELAETSSTHASIDFSAAARCFLAVRFNRVSAVSSAAEEFPD